MLVCMRQHAHVRHPLPAWVSLCVCFIVCWQERVSCCVPACACSTAYSKDATGLHMTRSCKGGLAGRCWTHYRLFELGLAGGHEEGGGRGG